MADVKIADFCSPIFEKVVAWGLESDPKNPIDTNLARTTLNDLIDRLRLASRQQPKIGQQFVQVELPLLFFIDFVMQERIHLSSPWAELAFERNELAGDEKFFDLLEQTLGSPTDSATDRVEVFYQCMALGFCGTYAPESPELHRIFRRCALRLGLSPDLVESGQLTPEAYEHLDLVSKHRPFNPRKWRWAVAICVGCLVATHFANQFLFRIEVQDIRRQLDKIGAYANLSPSRAVLEKAAAAARDPRIASESDDNLDIVLPERSEPFAASASDSSSVDSGAVTSGDAGSGDGRAASGDSSAAASEPEADSPTPSKPPGADVRSTDDGESGPASEGDQGKDASGTESTPDPAAATTAGGQAATPSAPEVPESTQPPSASQSNSTTPTAGKKR